MNDRNWIWLAAVVVAIYALAGGLRFAQDGGSAFTGALITGAIGVAVVAFAAWRARNGAPIPPGPTPSAPGASIGELRARRNRALVRFLALLAAIVLIWVLVFALG